MIIASQPDRILAEWSTSSDNKIPVLGRWMSDGLFVLPELVLAELNRLKLFVQQPSVSSMTEALAEAGYLLMNTPPHKKYRARFNGGNVYGWN